MGAWRIMNNLILLWLMMVASLHVYAQTSDLKSNPSRIPLPLAGILLSTTIEDGTQVSVAGYMEGPFLFLTKDHAQILDYASSIRIQDLSYNAEIYSSACSQGRYVLVIGNLYKIDAINWELRDVSRILDQEEKKNCYSK